MSPLGDEQASTLLTALLAERFDRTKVAQGLLERHRRAIHPTHPEVGSNGIRFSLHEFNSASDLDRASPRTLVRQREALARGPRSRIELPWWGRGLAVTTTMATLALLRGIEEPGTA